MDSKTDGNMMLENPSGSEVHPSIRPTSGDSYPDNSDEANFRRTEGVMLSWRNLSVYTAEFGQRNTRKQLIHCVKGYAKPGELVAILGSSGAGKSSLMAALAFRSGPEISVVGDIRGDGELIDASYMMRHSGYMHQEDMFIESMTVHEHLWFMARMKLDRRTRYADIRDKVEYLVREVGLSRNRETLIGGGTDDNVLSGGEKKRLSFATEILFLDEPTTGLDSHSASALATQLTFFARKGRTVLCTIHQPSSKIFDSFDRIILLAEGRIAFAGTTERALLFFRRQGYECPRNYNPADFLLATLSSSPREENAENVPQKIWELFLKSDAAKEIHLILETEIQSRLMLPLNKEDSRDCALAWKEPRFYSRLYWLVQRGFLQVLRDPSVQIARLLQKVIIAITAGLCFVGAVKLDQLGIQAVQGVIFILVSENAFFPMYATLALIPQELPLLRREYRAGMYPISLYYIARILSLLPGFVLEPLFFTAIIYWLAGLRSTMEAFVWTLIVLVLTMNVSTACGCFFSAVFGNVPLAMAYLVPFDYILMITMGPFIKLGSLPIYMRWVKYISWLLHSSEALTILQWRDVRNVSCEITEPELPCITDGASVLQQYNFDETNFYQDLFLMLLVYTLFHVCGCICLWKRCRSN